MFSAEKTQFINKRGIMRIRIRFINYRRRFVVAFNFTSLKNIGYCLTKFSLKIPLSVLFRCNLLLFRFCDLYGLCVIFEENILLDAKTFQVAICCNIFLVVFIVTDNDIKNTYINGIS